MLSMIAMNYPFQIFTRIYRISMMDFFNYENKFSTHQIKGGRKINKTS